MIQFNPRLLPNEIVIFGCGGTGGRLVPQLAQFLKTLTYLINPKMYLFDFDQVEEKNLKRQNFIPQDVNKYKSEVLANRYSKAFGIQIMPSREDISKTCYESKAEFSTTLTSLMQSKSSKIFILCVDSIAARKNILATLFDRNLGFALEDSLIIDTGNEDTFGQFMICGTRFANPGDGRDSRSYEKAIRDLGPVPYTMQTNHLPFNSEYFLDMQPPAVAASCADLDQTMAINSLVATSVFGMLQNLYFGKPLTYHRMNINLDGGSFPQYLTSQHFLNVLAREEAPIPASDEIGNKLRNAGRRLYAQSGAYQWSTAGFFSQVYHDMSEVKRKIEAEEAAAERKRKAAEEKRLEAEAAARKKMEEEAKAEAAALAAKAASELAESLPAGSRNGTAGTPSSAEMVANPNPDASPDVIEGVKRKMKKNRKVTASPEDVVKALWESTGSSPAV